MVGSWSDFLDYINVWNVSDRLLFVILIVLCHTGTFWVTNALLVVCYRFNWFPRQRIQGSRFPPDALIQDCIIKIFTSHFIIGPFVVYYIFCPLYEYRGISLRGPIPTFDVWIRDFIVFALVNDCLFYWTHRFLHIKQVYQRFHKQHHEFHTPIGIAAQYAHPVEDLLSNTFPAITGPVLMGSHSLVMWSWICVRVLQGINSHCGYQFEWSPFNWVACSVETQRHDFHHSHNQGCYGTVMWDRMMGTDKEFEVWLAKLKKEH